MAKEGSTVAIAQPSAWSLDATEQMKILKESGPTAREQAALLQVEPPLTITNVYRFPNNMVMVFDQHGQQMPEYQGTADEMLDKIKAIYDGPIIDMGEIKAGIGKSGL